MANEKQTCWICEEYDECPYPVCYPVEESKELAEDWDEGIFETNETQLELEL